MCILNLQKDSLSPFYQPAYDILLGLHDINRHILLLYLYIYIYIYIYVCVCMCVCVCEHTHTHRCR